MSQPPPPNQQPSPPWRSIPNNQPPAGYRPRLQQPYGQPTTSPRQPGRSPKKRLPVIAWIGIGIVGLIIVAAIASSGTTSGTNAAVTATPRSTTGAARVATATLAPTASAVVASPTRGATPTIIPTHSPVAAAPAQVVTVKDNPVNVRQSADANAPVVASLDVGADAPVLGEDTTGVDGATRWVHVRAGDKDGYVRSDLVSEHHAATSIASVAPSAIATVPGATQAATSTPQSAMTKDDREAALIAQGIDTWRKLDPASKITYAQALIDQYPKTTRHPTTAQIVTSIDLYGKEFPNRHEDFGDLGTIYLGYADGTTVGDFANMQENDARLAYANAIAAIDALPCGSRWDEMQAFAKKAIVANAAVSVESFGIFYRDELRRQTGNFSAACRDINQRTP